MVVSVAVAVAFAGSVGGAHAQPTLVLPGLNCGLGGPTSQLVPLVLRNKAGHPISPQSYPFTGACKKHDQCYAHWGISRGSCDQAFGLDMHAVCQVQPSAARADCEYVGEEYHSAVVRKGAVLYRQTQQASLDAALNGVYTGLAGRVIVTGGPNGTVTLPWKGKVTVAQGRFPTLAVTSPMQDSQLSQFERIKEHPSSVTGDAEFSFDPPAGYVGGAIQVDLAFHWGGGILPASVKGTFSSGSLVDDANQEPVTFSGSFSWTKSHK